MKVHVRERRGKDTVRQQEAIEIRPDDAAVVSGDYHVFVDEHGQRYWMGGMEFDAMVGAVRASRPHARPLSPRARRIVLGTD